MPLLLALFFFSGISGLIYQTVWMRMLIRIFGISLYAISTIVAVFMAGLALGSWLASTFLRKSHSPLRVYAWLEGGIGVSAVIASVAMKYAPQFYALIGSQWYGDTSHGSALLLLIVRLVLACCILAVPTILMGATLPILGQYVTEGNQRLGEKLAYLYGINTLGAVFGVLLTGFVTLAFVGESGSIAIGIVLNFVVAFTAFVLTQPENRITNSETVEIPNTTTLLPKFLLAVAMGSGFCAISLEVLWTRLLIFLVGSSVYAFSIVLSMVLLGIACGSLVATRFVDRLKNPGLMLGAVQMVIGLSALFSLYIFWSLGAANTDPRFLYSPLLKAGNLWQFFGVSALVIFATTFFMGISFPLLGRTATKHSSLFAASVGKLYAWNTLGGVIGSLITGYWMVPAIGTQAAFCLVTFAGLVFGGVVVIRYSDRSRIYWLYVSSAVLLFLMAMPTKTNIVIDILQRRLVRVANGIELFFHRDEAAGMLSGVRLDDTLLLLINGIVTSGNGAPGHVMAHLPLLLHPAPQKAAVICFGVGNTFRAAVDHVKNVDAIELMPGVIQSFGDFYTQSERYLSAPGAHIFVEDGRQHMLMTSEHYDVIVVDASPPLFSAGTVNLYTTDFLKICRQKLTPNGIMCLWVPTPCFENDYWQIAKSFSLIFPHLFSWRKEGMAGVLLMGSSANFKDAFAQIPHRLSQRSLGESTSWLTANFIDDAGILFDEQIRNRANAYQAVTDDQPRTEFPLGKFLRHQRYWLTNEFLTER